MSPQTNFIWIAIVAVMYGATWFFLSKLARAIGPSRWRWAVIAPIAAGVLAAPWVDELWIAWRFGELCKDAGVHIARKVEVEGYLDETFETYRGPPSAQASETFEKRGYQFYEMRSRDKYVVREKKDGVWTTSIRDQPTSRYHYRTVRRHADAGLQISAFENVVVDSQNGEIIGRRVQYNRYPGWVNGLWIRFLGSGMTMCPESEHGAPQPLFPESVLIPKNSR